jgi:hypothetical protein
MERRLRDSARTEGICAGCAQVLWTPVYLIGYMLAILRRARVMIIKQLAALAVLALTVVRVATITPGEGGESRRF